MSSRFAFKGDYEEEQAEKRGSRFRARRSPGQFTMRAGSDRWRRVTPCEKPEIAARRKRLTRAKPIVVETEVVVSDICGAMTKGGRACQSKMLMANGRCRLHQEQASD